MRKLNPAEIEFVYRRIAGHVKCLGCGKWIDPQENRWGQGYCFNCLSQMLIPRKIFDEIHEAAKILRRNEYFESS